MQLGLQDKVILVSGGAKGIGEGIVRVLAAEGALPVTVITRMSRARAAPTAASTFLLFPLVLMPISASPGLPNPSNCRANMPSNPSSLVNAVKNEVSVVSAMAGMAGRTKSCVKRLINSAARCCASAALPPLPQIACVILIGVMPIEACSHNRIRIIRPQLIARDLQVDDLIDFADSLPAKILSEIENFWDLGEVFQRHGYLHRRGYLLYGPQGSGKSSVVHQVVHPIIKAGHCAVFCEHPGFLTRAMEVFRKIEPNRPVICLFEDIDSIIELHGDSELLQWLDGSHQINKVINIATTNYPERLDRRIA